MEQPHEFALYGNVVGREVDEIGATFCVLSFALGAQENIPNVAEIIVGEPRIAQDVDPTLYDEAYGSLHVNMLHV